MISVFNSVMWWKVLVALLPSKKQKSLIMSEEWVVPSSPYLFVFLSLISSPSHLLPSSPQLLSLRLLPTLIAAIRAGSGGAAGCCWCCRGWEHACLSGLWSRPSPGMQPGVLGTFPLLSSFNYGPIMKAARSAATHHTLRGRRRQIPPSISSSHHIICPLHQPPPCHVDPSLWLLTFLCSVFVLVLVIVLRDFFFLFLFLWYIFVLPFLVEVCF